MIMREAITRIISLIEDEYVVCANGFISRDTFNAKDRKRLTANVNVSLRERPKLQAAASRQTPCLTGALSGIRDRLYCASLHA